MHHFEKM